LGVWLSREAAAEAGSVDSSRDGGDDTATGCVGAGRRALTTRGPGDFAPISVWRRRNETTRELPSAAAPMAPDIALAESGSWVGSGRASASDRFASGLGTRATRGPLASLRPGIARRTRPPHSMQNVAVDGVRVPHRVHAVAREEPHSEQKLAITGLWWPQA
jgi:hypothetical protein